MSPDAKVIKTSNSDNRFCVWVSCEKVNEVVSHYIDNLNYTNFKKSFEEQGRLRPVIRLYRNMYEHHEAQLNARSRDFI